MYPEKQFYARGSGSRGQGGHLSFLDTDAPKGDSDRETSRNIFRTVSCKEMQRKLGTTCHFSNGGTGAGKL